MKKFISLLLVFCITSSLAACGNSTTQDDSLSNQAQINSNNPSEKNTDNPSPQPEHTDETLGAFSNRATLEETVLVDENGIKITATGLNYTNYSVELELTIENNSDKDLSFISRSMGYSCNSVNGYMVSDGYLNCDVAAGKKANDSISFDYDGLMLYGINEIADMEIGFDISDDDYNHTYSGPRPLKTSAFESHDYSVDYYGTAITSQATMNTYGYEITHFSQDTLYDEGGIKLMSSGVMTNRGGDTILLLELLNTTDNIVYMTTSNISINGLAIYSSTWSSDAINPGKHVIIDINLTSVLDTEYWNIYGIREVSAVSLSLSQKSQDYNIITDPSVIEVVVPGTECSFDSTGTEIYSNNGLRIIAKTILEDPSEYSSDMYVLLLAENNSGTTLTIDDVYDSLSVNGFMTDYSYYSMEVKNGSCALLEVKLWESALENNRISSVSDVIEVEIRLEIKEGKTMFDQPVITIPFD